jgi:ABC-type branched-subunit amino acid transport system ATPase component
VSKSFGGVNALSDVSFTLGAGEILALIGPNGAGKSTLINIVSGVDTPTKGVVEFDGRPLESANSASLAAAGLARTFQSPTLFGGMSVLDNVMVGAYLRGRAGMLRSMVPTRAAVKEEHRTRRDAQHLLDVLGLRELEASDANDLSLGHAKKLEIARALALQPRVLLLDEPAAGLNRSEKLSLAQLIGELRTSGLAILLVEHDMELVMGVADRVHVLEFGHTIAEGTPAEVQADEAVIAAYLGTDTDDVVEAIGSIPVNREA